MKSSSMELSPRGSFPIFLSGMISAYRKDESMKKIEGLNFEIQEPFSIPNIFDIEDVKDINYLLFEELTRKLPESEITILEDKSSPASLYMKGPRPEIVIDGVLFQQKLSPDNSERRRVGLSHYFELEQVKFFLPHYLKFTIQCNVPFCQAVKRALQALYTEEIRVAGIEEVNTVMIGNKVCRVNFSNDEEREKCFSGGASEVELHCVGERLPPGVSADKLLTSLVVLSSHMDTVSSAQKEVIKGLNKTIQRWLESSPETVEKFGIMRIDLLSHISGLLDLIDGKKNKQLVRCLKRMKKRLNNYLISSIPEDGVEWFVYSLNRNTGSFQQAIQERIKGAECKVLGGRTILVNNVKYNVVMTEEDQKRYRNFSICNFCLVPYNDYWGFA